MIDYRIDCENCGEPRMARGDEDGLVPLKPKCPECGHSEYRVPAFE